MAFTFGSGGGFGQQNQTPGQQQNQQQQSTPAFGGFGGGAFGSTTPATGFGQQQPQQQSTGLFGGGGFGSTTNATPAFGASNTGATGGGGLFGSQNATSTPAFGGGANTGTGGFSFGAQQGTTGGGLFGSTNNQSTPGVFGSGGTGFGANKPLGVGNTLGGGGMGGGIGGGDPNSTSKPNPACPVPTNGTADVPSDPTNPNKVLLWKDERSGEMMGADGKVSNITGEKLNFDNIVAFPMYWHVSPEELRVQDYQQGRKTAPAAAATGFGGGFGQSTTTPAFGASGGTAFGQSGNTSGGGLFGSRPAGTPGGATGGGLFGSAGANTGAGAFGKPATPAFGQTATGTTGGGLFGQPAQNQGAAAGGAFGAPGATAGASGFGGFGQAQQQNKPAFSFGATPAQPSGGGLFGQTNTTTPAFGQSPAQQPSGFSFGQNNTAGASTGLFGQNKPAGTGLFGGGATGTDNKPSFSFGATNNATQPSTGLFGQQNQQPAQQQPATGGGLFGNLGQSTNTFGQNNTTAGTGGLFGNNANKPAGGGLFGNTNTTGGAAAPGFSFGGGAAGGQQQQNNAQPATTGLGGGLFGGGSSLFGNNQNQQNTQQQQPQQAGTGLFGGGASTFGTGATGGGGLFGNLGQNQNQQQQQPQQQSTGLFGSTAPQLGGGGGGFGGFGQPQNNLQNQSLLGQSQQQAPLQPLNLSIDQNPYGNNPIFANVQPAKPSEGPRAYDADQSKKQLPLHISYRGTPRSSIKINKLRGFATSASSPGLGASRFGSPATPGTPLINSLNRPGTASPAPGTASAGAGALDLSFSLPPQAFAARPSVKKLIIDKKHRDNPDLLFGRGGRASGTATPTGEQSPAPAASQRAVFNPDAETAERNSVPLSRDGSRTMSSANKGKAPIANGSAVDDSRSNSRSVPPQSNKPLQEGDYYTKPDFRVLQSMSEEDLAEVHDFVVGRVGYGEICWLEPVDLTGLPSLRELLDKVVIIKDKEVMVYPDEYDDEKPEVGQGLNVPAVISLKNCWPLDRATREPLKDPNHQRVKQHIRKLEKKEDTEFVDYEVSTGTWTFKVAHFSRYGLDSDDEDGEGDETVQEGNEASSPAVQRKKAIQDRSSRNTKKQRVTDSPVSDTTVDDDEDFEDEAPPQATLEDESMEDESATERSFSRTPVRRSESFDEIEGDAESDDEPRRRKRSVVVPTPRVQPPRRGQRDNRQIAQSATSRAGSEPSHQRPLPQRLGLEPKKLAVMQASFFSKPRKDEQLAEQAKLPPRQARERQPPLLEAPRPSDSQPVAPAPGQTQEDPYVPQYRPLREWKAVPLEKSLVNGNEGNVLDAGLMLDRSFRATFGPQGQLVTLGGITSFSTASVATKQTTINVFKPRIFADNVSTERDAAARTLQVQHAHTKIDSDSDTLPFASTLPSLRFHHFVSAFQSQDTSAEATLWRLGNALFDEIELGLPETVSDETLERVSRIRRTDAFSRWLREAVAPAVEEDLRRIASNPAESRSAATVFTLLTGNQVERACQAALAEGDVRLATLLSQVGGDDEFRADVGLQLAKWRESRVDPLIGKDYRKIYEVLSGNVGASPGITGSSKVDSSESIMISEDLDWKRAFALRFWYAEFNASIPSAIKRYDADASKDLALALPIPSYKVEKQPNTWALADGDDARDILYELIKLYSDVRMSLEIALSPRAASSSPYAYRKTWHLYQLLSRALQVREFDDVDASGYSELSQSVIGSYADELEKSGLWEWAAFVLLHLVDPSSREKAIRELLARHVGDFDQNNEAFLVGNLSIPQRFLEEAREMYGDDQEEEEREELQ